LKYTPPRARRQSIREQPTIPSFPNLISKVLINQQGFDVNFGEHGLLMESNQPEKLGYLWRN